MLNCACYIFSMGETLCLCYLSSTYEWRRKWQPTPVLLLREFHGQKSLVGCPWGRTDRTWLKRLSMHACIGEGNGNPLSVLAWRIPGIGEPGGLPSMGSHRVRHNWSNLPAAAVSVRVFKVVTAIPCSLWPFCTDCHHRLGPGWAVLLGGSWWGALERPSGPISESGPCVT